MFWQVIGDVLRIHQVFINLVRYTQTLSYVTCCVFCSGLFVSLLLLCFVKLEVHAALCYVAKHKVSS
jgi:hypothetical protein